LRSHDKLVLEQQADAGWQKNAEAFRIKPGTSAIYFTRTLLGFTESCEPQ
jgi:hypothetical protein